MDRRNELLVRAYFVMFVFVVLSIVIIARVGKVSVIEGDVWREKGGKKVDWVPVKAERGNIYSADGELLATSLMFFEIRMDLKQASEAVFNKGIDSLSINLANHIGRKTAAQWKADLMAARIDCIKNKKPKPGSRYLFIAKDLNYEQMARIKTFPIFRLGGLKGGLIINKYGKRNKPYQSLAGRTIGEDRENASKVGLEGFFDKYLTGEEDKKLMQNVGRNIWLPLYDPTEHSTKRGDDLVTTLDMQIQDIVHQELLATLYANNASGGCAIVMEVKTGAIKALSNFQQNKKGDYAEIRNHAVGRLNEPGSTFKLATAMALLEDGFVSLNTKVDLQGGKKKFADLWMYDSHMHGIHETDFRNAFQISSNVGMATLANKFYNNKQGKEKWSNRLDQFKLREQLGIEIVGEGKPFVKKPANKKDWYGTTIPWMAHGYELLLTPLQTLAMYNSVANDGKMMKPYLVSEVMHEGKTVKKINPKVLKNQIASTKTIRQVQELLEGVVKEGTGKSVRSEMVSIAGKTGTATDERKKRTENRKVYNGSFAGYFPAENPKYSVMVMVYDPKKQYYGGAVAGPVFKRIAEKIYSVKRELVKEINDDHIVDNTQPIEETHAGFASDYENLFDYVGIDYGKSTKSKWVEIDPSIGSLEMGKKKFSKKKVPDVRGMGLRDAVYVLENFGLSVMTTGFGKVVSQSLNPGAKLDKETIRIVLK